MAISDMMLRRQLLESAARRRAFSGPLAQDPMNQPQFAEHRRMLAAQPDPMSAPQGFTQALMAGIPEVTDPTTGAPDPGAVQQTLSTVLAGGGAGTVPGAALGSLGFRAPSRTGRVLEESKELLAETPAVPQMDLPRFMPPKGRPETIGRLYEPQNIERVKGLALRGADQGGLAWYNTEPVRAAAVETLGEEAGNLFHRQLVQRLAATSPRSSVADNIRRASFFQTQAARGGPLPDPAVQPPSPYGHIAHRTHAPLLREIAEEGAIQHPLLRPKAVSFAENLGGNQAPLTADAHFVRAIGLQKKSGAPETGAPSKTQYEGVEAFGKDMAAELGMTPAQFQASLWMGAAEETGVRNPQIFMQAFNDSLEKTAKQRGVEPLKVLQDFLRGKAPLLSLPVGMGAILDELYGSLPDEDV